MDIECFLKNKDNFSPCDSDDMFDCKILNGRTISLKNENKFLLLKKVNLTQNYKIYDSGFFEGIDEKSLLKEYILKPECTKDLANQLHKLLSILKYWYKKYLDKPVTEKRFKINGSDFSENTMMEKDNIELFVGDWISIPQEIFGTDGRLADLKNLLIPKSGSSGWIFELYPLFSYFYDISIKSK
jgi:hypothetical protein